MTAKSSRTERGQQARSEQMVRAAIEEIMSSVDLAAEPEGMTPDEAKDFFEGLMSELEIRLDCLKQEEKDRKRAQT